MARIRIEPIRRGGVLRAGSSVSLVGLGENTVSTVQRMS
jgi:hypothetical protein